MTIAERVAEVRQRLAAAAAASGRPADAITLIAATKTQSPETIAAALAAGVDEVGENYVQEAAGKRERVPGPARWRLIGPLQRNKINIALRLFASVDTVGDLELAQALNQRVDGVLEVLLQVRLGGEESKSGVEPAEAGRLLAGVQLLPGLMCLGLMTMPPPVPPDEGRRYFEALAALAERLRQQSGLGLPVLSMGMSHDYEAAIAAGATHVRVGTALFGPRG